MTAFQLQRLFPGAIIVGALLVTWSLASEPSGRALPWVGDHPAANGLFVENLGQWPTGGRFVARPTAANAWSISSHGFDGVFRSGDLGVSLRFSIVEARAVEPVGIDPAPGLHHDYRGPRDRWIRGARAFRAIRYASLLDGVDLVLRDSGRAIEYDFWLDRADRVDGLTIRIEGAESLEIDKAGRLIAHTAVGAIVQPLPRAATLDGARVECRFEPVGCDRFGFRLEGIPPDEPVWIDPEVIWASYWGGSELDECKGLGVRADGRSAVGGLTQSVDFPVTPGAFEVDFGGGFTDGVVTVFEPDGTLVFSSFIGGLLDRDVVLDCEFAADGSLFVGGSTNSPDFPTTPGAYDETFSVSPDPNAADGYVAHFSETGDALLYSTLIGGVGIDEVAAVKLSTAGRVFFAGTAAEGFPTTPGAASELQQGTSDAFVAELSADGSALLFSTLFGGSVNDGASVLLPLGTSELLIAGLTESPDLPVTSDALDSIYGSASGSTGSDAFVARISQDGSELLHASYLGGAALDRVWAGVRGADGRVVLSGRTASTDFPVTAGVLGESYHGGSLDGFVTVLSADATTLLASTYIGGSDRDEGRGLGIEAGGAITVGGSTNSLDLPTTPDAYQPTFGGSDSFGGDAYVLRLTPNLSSRTYATYLGGPGAEHTFALEIDGDGIAVLAGLSFAPGFGTTPNAPQPSYAGGITDDLIVRIDPRPRGRADFIRGDANGDDAVNIADGVAILGYLFLSGSLDCVDAGDFDAGGTVDVADPVGLFTWAFLSGPPPAAPFPECGPGSGSCLFSPCP